jgi:hypothetical protein
MYHKLAAETYPACVFVVCVGSNSLLVLYVWMYQLACLGHAYC